MKIFSFLVIGLLIVAVWFLKPYVKGENVRLNGGLETIEAEYSKTTGEGFCTNLYRVVNGKITDDGIFTNMPADIPDPNTLPELKNGARVLLTGYVYEWRETNLITGSVSKRKSNMIDVVRWQTAARVSYKTQQGNLGPTAFRNGNYTNCRA
ncbi:hypothetical protein SG34_014275 [Thalassomonas viridans]|uniref:Uncharacterized protein n=1 Tax=Thalassomonas viridans TaxID=137584 RepID=A0AAF0C9W5_9GAMM|nr:hypothetical protein [Thalassomonas viridans]WDE07947.1 hypothetical protein SG34_014275 [Thalassomonas viridans]